MGTLTHVELRAEVRAALGNRTDLTDPEITRALNLQQERIARVRDWEEMRFREALTAPFAGDKLVDKFLPFTALTNAQPKELWTVRVITGDVESAKLERVQVQDWDQLIPEPEYWDANTPTHYTIWDKQFEWWKVPDKAYKFEFRGIKWPLVFSTDNQKSDFDRKDDIILWSTISYLWNQRGEYQRADRFFGMFSTLIEEAHLEDHTEPDLVIKPAHQYRDTFRNKEYWLDPEVKGVR